MRNQETESARQARRRREAEARKIADAVIGANAEIDAAMIGLRGMFERRSALLSELAQTKIVAPNYLLRLHQKFGATAAARQAGLEKFMALEHVPIANICPLVESNGALSGPLSATTVDEEAA